MKNFNKIFFAAVAAAFGLASCSQELTPVEKPQGNLVTVNFGAEASITCPTKATLTTEDEKLFTSAWENGDALSVKYISPGTTDNKTITATWTGTSFEAKGLPNETGAWNYTACYPKPDESDSHIDFGATRTQKGNAYNSIYDVMIGNKSTKNSAAGKDDEGNDIVFNMDRKTAVAYFHLTGGPADEELVSAKLSVKDGFIASQHAYISNFTFAPTEDLTEITITFPEKAPKASDFQLWFNVLPTKYTKMTLTVETANHTMTISRNTPEIDEYVAGNLYKVFKAIPAEKWVKKEGETPIPSSYKIEFNNKSQQVSSIEITTKASTFVVTGTEYLEAQPFSNLTYAYYGGNESNGLPLRIGKSRNTGSITMALSKAGQVNANKIILSAKQFSTGKTFNIGVNDSAKQQPGEDYTDLEFELDGSPLTSIKLDSDGYIFVKSITVVSGPVDNTIPTLSVDQTSKTWAADATDAFVVKVTVNSEGGDWTVTPETLSWATIAVDKTAGTITVTPNGANETETANEAKLTVTHTSDASLKKEITLKQNAAGGATTPVVLYTLTPTNGTNNSYASNCDVTVDGITWNLMGNSQINPWRLGGKNITNVDRALYSKTAYPKALTSIKVTFGTATNITINSCKLVYSTNADFTDSKECNITFTASSTVEVTENFPANAYYKLVLNVTNNKKDKKGKYVNGYVELSKIEFLGLNN